MTASTTLDHLAAELAARSVTSRSLVEACLEAIAAAGVEGERVFPHGLSTHLRDEADRQDRLRREGRAASPFAGIPISLKDNIDQAGQATRAGSHLFDHDPPAAADAPVAARLRAAGFVVMGRTNMTELAFSGLGLNPHYGTPRNPRSPDQPRIPGGSSAGAAVSVASGMAHAAVGTDTGGSCRIPAAFCGLVGFKPTGRRVPRDGVYPLSTTLDCVGPLAVSARCCTIMDAIMAGEAPPPMTSGGTGSVRLGLIVETYVLDEIGEEVSDSYDRAIARLRAAGVAVEPAPAAALSEVAGINTRGGFSSAELYARLRERLATEAEVVDPRVLRRVMMGADSTEASYRGLQEARARLIVETDAVLDGFDAVLMPTTIVAPRFEEVAADEAYDRINRLVLRNPSIANMLDRPAITLPCEPPGALPVGLTLMGGRGRDAELLALAERLEPTVRGR